MALGRNKVRIPELIFPIYLRPKSSDILAFHQIFTFKEYDMNFGMTPNFIIDAGANIGLSAVFFSNKFPNATLVAIEPEKNNFDALRKNTENYPNVLLEKKALSNQDNLFFDVIDKGYGNWGFVTENKNIKGNTKIVDTVQTITIDAIMATYNLEYLDLLKIDIEGAEKILFESNYEIWLPKTKCLLIELHDGITKGSSQSFFKAISKYDFSYFNRGENLLFINNAI
ncbi:FkbM family methyltransferase [Flavobacterium faecale]|nr:FkbM family methyltransferase [Flavobacterium faecale]